jgi:transcriptional regulator with XRE-family HTH domain
MAAQAHASQRELETRIRHLAGSVHQSAIADAMGVSPSTVSRIFSGEAGVTLEHLQAFLAAVGFQAVPLEELSALHYFARKALDKPESAARGR